MPEAVYLNQARAQKAIELAEPTVLKMLQTVANKKALVVVVLGVGGEVLHEAQLGPDVVADAERLATCKVVARAKAAIHFRTGRPSAEIQARHAHSLLVGDTIWGGSASYEGIIVAVSGIQAFYDESIAGMVAAVLWGLCVDAQQAYVAKPDRSTIYKAPQ